MNLKQVETRYFDEIKSQATYYMHPSGARIIHMQNEDENKVFSVSFRTPVWDNTGVAHILEHSILCGSKKYPIKDPFNEMCKSSLYTYLNAMTFTDKTVYPIASCNKKDFFNLMDVYLDAVFNPLIRRREIFMQEGILYNPEEKSFGGIVYNEMQGVYSDPLEYLRYETSIGLFPDTQNAYDAGGKPDSIETLTFDQLLAFYDKHYKPSNAYVFLYGDMDFDECMKHIEPYLAGESSTETIEIKYQPAFDKPKFLSKTYPATENKEELLAANYIIENPDDSKYVMGLMLINQYLFGTNTSPLKQLLMDEGFGKEIFSSLNMHLCQPVYHITVKHAEKSIEELYFTLFKYFNELLTNGFDQAQLTAAVNILEFDIREEKSGSYPKGLNINIGILTNWLYGHDPFEKVNKLEPFLAAAEDKEFLFSIIRNTFISNKHVLFIDIRPESPVTIPVNFTPEQLENFQKDRMCLELFQSKEDKKEDIDKIPVLHISDIDKTIESFPLHEESGNGLTMFSYYQDTADIGYMQLMFDISALTWDEIPYIGILCNLLGRIDTKNYKQKDLTTEINTYLGGLRPMFSNYTNVITGEYIPVLAYKSKALLENSDKMFKLIQEITQNTVFSTAQILPLLNEQLSALESALRSNGMGFASGRSLAYIDLGGRYEDAVYGIEYYQFLKKILSAPEALPEKLKDVAGKIFEGYVRVYVSAKENQCRDLLKKANSYYASQKNPGQFPKPTPIPVNEGIISGANVQNVAYSFDFGKAGFNFNGETSVITTILNRSYLMSEVRLKGGAYGCNCVAYKKGLFSVCSYRDPHLQRTLDVYQGISRYLADFQATQEDMNKFLIGTINRYLRPKKVIDRVEFAIAAHLNAISHSTLEKECEEILAMQPAQVKKYAEMFEKCHQAHVFSVVGGKEQITKSKDIFSAIY